jgi:hypothetical protein
MFEFLKFPEGSNLPRWDLALNPNRAQGFA